MDDEKFAPFEQDPSACPFVALEDDRDRRSDAPDYRHRCYASLQPEPRAFPHQERYCLSRGFTGCPIFLDWAQREAAAVVPGRRSRPAPAGAAGAGAGPVSAAPVAPAAATIPDAAERVPDRGSDRVSDRAAEPGPDDIAVPAFLAGRGRGAGAGRPVEPDTVADPDQGLWGPTDQRRAPQRTAVATARPNRGQPDWEPISREERYPRIKRRSNNGALQAIVLLIVVVAALAVLFFFLPGLIPSGSHPVATATPTSRATKTPTPTITPTPAPTQTTYVIKPGDSFSGIAAKFGLTVDELKAANPQVTNVDVIKDGDVLIIPVKGGPGPSATAAP